MISLGGVLDTNCVKTLPDRHSVCGMPSYPRANHLNATPRPPLTGLSPPHSILLGSQLLSVALPAATDGNVQLVGPRRAAMGLSRLWRGGRAVDYGGAALLSIVESTQPYFCYVL